MSLVILRFTCCYLILYNIFTSMYFSVLSVFLFVYLFVLYSYHVLSIVILSLCLALPYKLEVWLAIKEVLITIFLEISCTKSWVWQLLPKVRVYECWDLTFVQLLCFSIVSLINGVFSSVLVCYPNLCLFYRTMTMNIGILLFPLFIPIYLKCK